MTIFDIVICELLLQMLALLLKEEIEMQKESWVV
jgi:hypothetical protein